MASKAPRESFKDIGEADMSEYVGPDFVIPMPPYAITRISKKELAEAMKKEKSGWDKDALRKLLERNYTCPTCPYPHDPAFKCGEKK